MEDEQRIRMHAEYLTMLGVGYPADFALERVSSNWRVSIDTLRTIVERPSDEIIQRARSAIAEIRAYAKRRISSRPPFGVDKRS
jgi:hypothetical protein